MGSVPVVRTQNGGNTWSGQSPGHLLQDTLLGFLLGGRTTLLGSSRCTAASLPPGGTPSPVKAGTGSLLSGQAVLCMQ